MLAVSSSGEAMARCLIHPAAHDSSIVSPILGALGTAVKDWLYQNQDGSPVFVQLS